MVTTRSSDRPSKVQSETSPTSETVDKFISLLSKTFSKVPLTTAFITEIDGVTPDTKPAPLSPDRLHRHFSLGIPTAAKANILLLHDDDFTTAALIEPPDFCGIPPGSARPNPGPILSEWRTQAKQLKAKHLALPDTSWAMPAAPSQSSGGPSEDPYPSEFNKEASVEIRPFYHVAMVAKDSSLDKAKQEAAVKALLNPILNKAKDEGVPVWAEASIAEKREEFERLGFRVAEEVMVGTGKINENGWPTKNGKGVRSFALIYDGHLQ